MESPRACFAGRPMQPQLRSVLIASLLFAYVVISRHVMFVSDLSGRLPAVSALVVIGRLKPPSSLISHALIHPYTPVLVGVALLRYHAAEAKIQVVDDENFKDTSYYGSPVRLNGTNISVILDEGASQVSVNWKFNSDWQIQLDKCDTNDTAQIEISDSCMWKFEWQDGRQFMMYPSTASSKWPLSGLNDPQSPVRSLRIDIGKEKPPTMDVCAVTDEDTCTPVGGRLEFNQQSRCMLAADPFSVSVANTAPGCPINVTIINAQLLYDFPEPTTMPPTAAAHDSTEEVNPALRTSTGHMKPSTTADTTMVQTSTTPTSGGGKILCSGFVLIAVASFASVASLLYDI